MLCGVYQSQKFEISHVKKINCCVQIQVAQDAEQLYESSRFGSKTSDFVKYLTKFHCACTTKKAFFELFQSLIEQIQDVWHYLTADDSECKLLASAQSFDDRVKFIGDQGIEKIFFDAKAGVRTLSCLKRLSEQGNTYTDLNDLIESVSTKYSDLVNNDNQLIAYLSSPQCKIFKLKMNFVKIAANLLDTVRANKFTLHHVMELNQSEFRCNTEYELLNAVKLIHAALLQDKSKVKTFLNTEDVFKQKMTFTESEIDTIVLKAEAGSKTFLNLQAVVAFKKSSWSEPKFLSVDELIWDIKVIVAEKKKVLHFLQTEDAFFCDKAVRKIMSAMFNEFVGAELTMVDIDQLFDIANSGFRTKYLIDELTEEGESYSTVKDLSAALVAKQEQFMDQCREILGFLETNQATLFPPQKASEEGVENGTKSPQGTLSPRALSPPPSSQARRTSRTSQKPSEKRGSARGLSPRGSFLMPQVQQQEERTFSKVDSAYVDYLLKESNVGSYCMMHLVRLQTTGASFTSLEDLPDAVRKLHVIFQRDFRGVFWYLTHDANSQLFITKNNVTVTRADLRKAYEMGHIKSFNTLHYLTTLSKSAIRFSSMDKLCVHLAAYRAQRIAVCEFVATQEGQFIKIKLTDDNLDRLFHECEATDIVAQLRTLGKSGRSYYAFNRMFEDINLLVAQKRLFLEFLSTKGAFLFSLPFALTRLHKTVVELVDVIYNEANCGLASLAHLYSLAEDPNNAYSSVAELVMAMKVMEGNSLLWREEVMAFLDDPNQHSFFRSNGTGPKIYAPDVDMLFDEGRAGIETLSHLRLLNASSVTVTSVKKLVPLLFKAHTNLVELWDSLSKYMNDPLQCRLFKGTELEGKITTAILHQLTSECSSFRPTLKKRLQHLDLHDQRFPDVEKLIAYIKRSKI